MPENLKKINLPAIVTVKKFSEILNLPVSTVITELMKNGLLASINETIDFETASIIAADLGFEVAEETIATGESLTLEKLVELLRIERESGETLKTHPPVVTILGHVDHGKTTLLDTIRKTNVAARESGGITQHITAYQVKKKGRLITFIDTPGHEAFSAMRERGVSLADIAVLVVAADDGVRPQTKEVIEYLLAKKIPTVVAINKIDKPEANVQRVKQELGEHGILLEDWGGDVLSAKVSAKIGTGIDDLLDNILLIAEVEDFKADPKRDALGVVLEAHLDPHTGPVATVLVKTGTLREGQDVVCGNTLGRVRRMEDFKGTRITEALPATPISLIGLEKTPNANDIVQVVGKKSSAKSRRDLGRLAGAAAPTMTAQKILSDIEEEKIKKFSLIIKADVQGSLEAIEQILLALPADQVAVDWVSTGVGSITESDVRLAASTNAKIYGFNIDATSVAKRLAGAGGVNLKNFKVIYELVEDVKQELIKLLPPVVERTDLGKMKVLAIFKTGKGDMIVGGRVTNGKVVQGAQIEVMRGENVIGQGKITALQENKVAVPEVEAGKECGIAFQGTIKIKEADTLVIYQETIKPPNL